MYSLNLSRLIIGLIAIALCPACTGSNSPGSAIPISPANQEFRHLWQSGVVVKPSEVGAKVSTSVMGADMNDWIDITQAHMATSFVQAGIRTTRWPGGKSADRYHWETNRNGDGACGSHEKPDQNSTFDNFMADIVHPAHLDVAITVNYGSNPQCTGGANPAEAAAWVKYANVTKGYHVTWWTVGNEQSEPRSVDLRSLPHHPLQYAQIVRSDYYPRMKAASRIPIKVCVDASIGNVQWDQTVFSQAKFDCVEVHFYPQKGTKVNDTFLIDDAPPKLTASIQKVKAELAAAGRPGTPIYLGEIGSAIAPADKQEMSITQALYAGQVIGEMLNDGITRATWHSGYDNCETPSEGGDFSKTLYGWQNFGGSMIFSDGTFRQHCGKKNVPLGTLMPTAVTFEVASHFVRKGEHMLGVSVVGMPDVRAYATTYKDGYALMLFNLNKTSSQSVPVRIDRRLSGSGGTVWWYDKQRYDASKMNVWNGPAYRSLSRWHDRFTMQLPPWSMTVVQTR